MRTRPFWLKNAMLAGNLLANLVSLALVGFLLAPPFGSISEEAWELMEQRGWFYDPLAAALLILATLIYERPMRKIVNLRLRDAEEPPELLAKARRRMLNEPYFLIAADLCFWMGAYLFYTGMLLLSGFTPSELGGGFLRSLFTSMVTMIFAFFVLQFIQQRWLSPFFFPHGRIHDIPGAYRIRISTRLTALFFALNFVPLAGLLLLLQGIPLRMEGAAATRLAVHIDTITLDIAIFMGMGILVTVLVTRNFTRPLRSITRVLKDIRNGDLDARVRVTTNDEIGYSGEVINEMAEGLEERELIKETFGKYVSDEVRDEILSGRIPLDGEAREATVLFADLRDFTPMVESTPPKEVVQVLNRYFRRMEAAVHRHSGLVLQYIGDEIEAVFGAPVYRADHPTDAVRTALEMRERLSRLNEELSAQDHPTLRHGIGIHSGRVVAATIGSPHRLSYALVGDTVNVASRLQGLTRELGTDILLSRETAERLIEPFPLKTFPPARVKGRSRPVEIRGLDGMVETFTTKDSERRNPS
jgi:adenylate cyclase